MSKKVYVDGDSIFLNIKQIPRLVDQLSEHEVYVSDNGGFSYWFEKEASKIKELKFLSAKEPRRADERRRESLLRSLRENQISEYWFITNQPIDVQSFETIMRQGCIIKIFDHNMTFVDTISGLLMVAD